MICKAQINKWLAALVNSNEDQLATMEQSWSYAHDLKEKIFVLKFEQDIMVPPMNNYIEEWVKRSLNEFINPM